MQRPGLFVDEIGDKVGLQVDLDLRGTTMFSQSAAQSTPPDVVREIFKPFATRLKVLENGSSPHFPWYLGHICSTWRAVFLHMHREFWSKIQFGAQPSREYTSAKRYIRISEFFLKQGRNLPISFDFIDDPFLPVFCALMAQHKRWLDASFSSLHSNKLLSAKVRLPLLQSLAIKHVENLEQLEMFKNAPNLTRLTLTTIPLLDFNWDSLTALELTDTRICRRFRDVLSQMESLEKLLVSQKKYSPGYHTPIRRGMPNIVLPRLKVLATVGPIIRLLSIIKTPVLEELYIDFMFEFWEAPRYDVEIFFKEYPCDRLTRLTIHSDEDWFVMRVLSHRPPHVQILNVILPANEAIYKYLTHSQDRAPVLPMMRELHVYYYIYDARPDMCLNKLRTMIKSRTESTNPQFSDLVFMIDERHADELMFVSCAVKPICESSYVRFKADVFDKDTDSVLSFLRNNNKS